MYRNTSETIVFFYRGAVAQDGRIEPGDMILQVNDISFEGLSNDDAVKILREAVQKPGYVLINRLLHERMTVIDNILYLLFSFQTN